MEIQIKKKNTTCNKFFFFIFFLNMKRQRACELEHGFGSKQFGKWMLFVKDLEECWNKIKKLDVYATVPNVKSDVIFIHSQTLDQLEIIQLGNDLVSNLNYTSPTGFLCYKANDKTGCSRMNTKENYTFRIQVPLTRQLNIPEFDELAMQSDSGYYPFEIGFQVKEHAKKLGAQYDRNTKKWYAETKEIWYQLAQYWKPIYNSDFSLFSFNIWKNQINIEDRMKYIVKEIKSLMPTIVLFQEVTLLAFQCFNPIMNELGYIGYKKESKDFFLVSYYLLKQCTFETFEMKRMPLINDNAGTLFDMTLKQNRSFHILTLSIKEEKIIIVNIHLAASEANSVLRLSQLQYIFNYVENRKCIIGGDTNLSNDDVVVLPEHFNDVWKVMGSSIKTMGTWNPRENTNLSHISKNVGMCRFDRIFTKDIFVQSLQLLFKDKIEFSNISQHVSDHFALFARFRL